MSLAPVVKRPSIHQWQLCKQQQQPLVSLTCYDYTTARVLDACGLDFLLVGDSLAMTVLGHENTLQVTLDEMIHHTRAVVKGAPQTVVVADMPFMSYGVTVGDTVRAAGKMLQQSGCQMVKMEGASPVVLDSIRQLVGLGIPVMGHLGLTPQHVNTLGGFTLQAKTKEAVLQLIQDAKALEAAGVSALVLELIPHPVASAVSQLLTIPTIGIGSGHGCDGQILVIDDILGRFDGFQPKFVRQYAQLGEQMQQAVVAYQQDVRGRQFPQHDTEAFNVPKATQAELLALLSEWQGGQSGRREASWDWSVSETTLGRPCADPSADLMLVLEDG